MKKNKEYSAGFFGRYGIMQIGKVAGFRRSISTVTALIILSLFITADIIGGYFHPIGTVETENAGPEKPNGAGYNYIENNGSALEVIGRCYGNGNDTDIYVPSSGSGNADIYVPVHPSVGIVTMMNLTLENPRIVNNTVSVVNNSLEFYPNYTILYEWREFIGRNSTFRINISSTDSYPIGSTDVKVDGTLARTFYGDGSFEFNISRSTPSTVNVSIEFYYKNGSLYSAEKMTVEFYDVNYTTIESPRYSIIYTPEVYNGSSGEITVNVSSGDNVVITAVNITRNGTVIYSHGGDGYFTVNISRDTPGEINYSVLFYSGSYLYAEENLTVVYVLPPTSEITRSFLNKTIITVDYPISTKVGSNATVKINATDYSGIYTHGDINVTVDGNPYTNFTGAGIYYFNVTSNSSGPVNITVYFYNNSDILQETVSFNISFFDNYNTSAVNGIEYTVVYPPVYYTGYTAHINITATDGTNLTIGEIRLYENGTGAANFTGAGGYTFNYTDAAGIVDNFTLIFLYDYGYNFSTESFSTSFVNITEYYAPPRVRIGAGPLNSFNTTTPDPTYPSYDGYDAIAMRFNLTRAANLTSIVFYGNYTILSQYGYLTVELRAGSVIGPVITSTAFDPVVGVGTVGWHEIPLNTGLLAPGYYYVVFNGSTLGGFGLGYDAVSWYYADKSGSLNSYYYDPSVNLWKIFDHDYLMTVHYKYWTNGTFDDVSFSGSATSADGTSVSKNMVYVSPDRAYILFNESDGYWRPDVGTDYVTVKISADREAFVDVYYNALYNVTDKTGTLYYNITNTGYGGSVNWRFNYYYNMPSPTDPLLLTLYDYSASIILPEDWYNTVGFSTSYSDDFDNSTYIILNVSASAENWTFYSHSPFHNITLQIYELEGTNGTAMAQGENMTVIVKTIGNTEPYYANMSVWTPSDTLLYTSVNYTPEDNNTCRFVPWRIPENISLGTYELFVYWSNGTEVGLSTFNFSIALRPRLVKIGSSFVETEKDTNCTFDVNFTDYYNGDNLTADSVYTNWTLPWSSTRIYGGIYRFELDVTGLPRASRRDIRVILEISGYKNATVVIPIYILGKIALEFYPINTTVEAYINSTVEWHMRLKDADLGFDLKNGTGGAEFKAEIDGNPATILTETATVNDDYYYIIRLPLHLYAVYPQEGRHKLNFTFDYDNATAHYSAYLKNLILVIRPLKVYTVLSYSNATVFDGPLDMAIYVSDNVRYITLGVNLTVTVYDPDTDSMVNSTAENAGIYAEFNGNRYPFEFKYNDNNSVSYYVCRLPVNDLEPGFYYGNVTVDSPDLENTSFIFGIEVIQRIKPNLGISLPTEAVEGRKLVIEGKFYYYNGSEYTPLRNATITVKVIFRGITDNITVYTAVTDSSGYFSIGDIRIPHPNEYGVIVIEITLNKTKYLDGYTLMRMITVNPDYTPLIINIILILCLAVAVTVFIMYFIVIPIRELRKEGEIEGSVFGLWKTRRELRRKLKSRVQNFIRVPTVPPDALTPLDRTSEAASAGSARGDLPIPAGGASSGILPKPTDINIIVIPPDEEALPSGKRRFKEEELINKDILLYRKERNLTAAVINEKLGRLEHAMEFYEQAAVYAEKLGQFSESLIYLQKAEKLSRILLDIYESRRRSYPFWKRLKSKFSAEHRKLVSSFKKHTRILKSYLSGEFLAKLKEREEERRKLKDNIKRRLGKVKESVKKLKGTVSGERRVPIPEKTESLPTGEAAAKEDIRTAERLSEKKDSIAGDIIYASSAVHTKSDIKKKAKLRLRRSLKTYTPKNIAIPFAPRRLVEEQKEFMELLGEDGLDLF